ncbi:MAG: hypothetical protein AB8F95_12785 [Bacteroidia bacterium]
MRNHKIFDILRSFDSKRLKRFADFLNSPYPKKSPKAALLGKYLIAFHPDFQSDALEDTTAFKAIETNKAFSKHELTRYLSLLLSFTEDFIAIEYLQEERFLKGSLLTRFYFETQNDVGLKRTINQNEKELSQDLLPDSTNFFYAYLNKKAHYNYCQRLKKTEEAQTHLYHGSQSLDAYYIIQLLQSAISYYQFHKQKPPKEKLLLLESAMEELSQKESQLPPLVQMWHFACRLTFNPEARIAYDNLKIALHTYLRDISGFDAHNFTLILINSLHRLLGNDRKKYLKERYDLYQIEIAEGWVVVDGVIGYSIFNNIIIASLALGKHEEAEAFLKKYKGNLLPEIHQDIVLYNQARIALTRAEFHESLRLVHQVAYLNHSITLGIKRIQIMCFFARGDLVQAQHIWNSMSTYIYRLDDGTKKLKARNLQFIKVIKLLMKEDWERKKAKYAEQIRGILSDSSLMPEVEWIEKMLDKMA